MPRIRIVSIAIVTLAVAVSLVALASFAGAVPDARLTIDDLDASPSEPLVGERVTVNVTAANSPGSPAPVNVTEVRLVHDEEVLDTAEGPGALSPGDSLDTQLWTRFDDPGEHRLSVEIVGELTDEEGDGQETVSVQRDLIVDVGPDERGIELRTQALATDDVVSDDDEPELGDDIDGIFGDGDAIIQDDDEADPPPMDSPLAVTVVNTGTLTAERVVVEPVVDGERIGPFTVPDVAAGTEERLLVDLGHIDSPANVTVEARYVTADGTDAITEAELTYPPRDGQIVVTGAELTHRDDGRVDVSANLANVGDREIDGVTVRVGDATGVQPGDAGSAYFVGVLPESDFMPAELTARVDEENATEIPLVVEYNDRGVRYTETLSIAYDSPRAETGESETARDLLTPARIGLSLGVVGLVTIALLVGRRRGHV